MGSSALRKIADTGSDDLFLIKHVEREIRRRNKRRAKRGEILI